MVNFFCFICKLPVYVKLCSVITVFFLQDYHPPLMNSILISCRNTSDDNKYICNPNVVHFFCLICELPVYVNMCSVITVFVLQDYRPPYIISILISFQSTPNDFTYICEILKWYTFFVLYVNYRSMSICVRSSQCLFLKITIRHI